MSDELMASLRAYFRESTAERLREMTTLLDALDENPGAREQLARHFHALSGLGATYGYPLISELGEEGERSNDPARWRELVDAVARALC
jgi:HPt (histidine-containing phosphotransfer) domain-containing protein